MKKQDLVTLIEAPRADDPLRFHRVSSMLASQDPQLQSLLWLLREGVIGRSHFQNLVGQTQAH